MSNPDLPFIPDLHIQLLTNLLDIKPKLNMPKTNTADLLSARHPPSPVSSTSVNSTHPNARLKTTGTHTQIQKPPLITSFSLNSLSPNQSNCKLQITFKYIPKPYSPFYPA